MATSKKTVQTNDLPTELIKARNEFKIELDDRIKIGKELLNSPIQNDNDYSLQGQEYSYWNDYNYELLRQSFNKTDNEYAHVYNQVGQYSSLTVVAGYRRDPQKDYSRLKQKISDKIDNLEKLVNKTNLLKSSVINQNIMADNNIKPDLDSVFIVHGQDDSAKIELALFLERLKLKAIILHEQASSGDTIIEKIEKHTNVGFGIVLYTPCDIGAKAGNEDKLQNRARQNVVFEHGYLIGKIGRKNVCALVKGNIEIPNDISGVVYISMGNSWKIDIARELKASGYLIDMNLIT